MTNKEKFRKEVREFYKTKESKDWDAWKVIDSIGAKYGLDAIDIDYETIIIEAEDLITEGKCNTLEEAWEILAENDRQEDESIAEESQEEK